MSSSDHENLELYPNASSLFLTSDDDHARLNDQTSETQQPIPSKNGRGSADKGYPIGICGLTILIRNRLLIGNHKRVYRVVPASTPCIPSPPELPSAIQTSFKSSSPPSLLKSPHPSLTAGVPYKSRLGMRFGH